MSQSLLSRFFDQGRIPGRKTYHFADPILVQKINVAIAIGRPLLMPWTGHSSRRPLRRASTRPTSRPSSTRWAG